MDKKYKRERERERERERDRERYLTYSITSMARTPDGSFTLDDFSVPTKSFSSSKQIFRDFFLFYHGIVCCVHSLESPHRGDSNEYTQHTIIV